MSERFDTEIMRALEESEFQLHYQPIVSLKRGVTTGFEALLRWQHPSRGLLGPKEFIPATESSGLIVPIGRTVLQRACQTIRAWQAEQADLFVAVNLSTQHWLDKSILLRDVQQALEASGLEANWLKLEITETNLIETPEAINDTLVELRQLGVHTSIDDFGTGYSSFSYLRSFPVDSLKIDKAFIQGMDTAPECKEIVKTIVTLAHSLGMEVVAEGVESLSQLAELKHLQCEFVQGNLFSPPLSEDAAIAFLATTPRVKRKSTFSSQKKITENAIVVKEVESDLSAALILRVVEGPAVGSEVDVDHGEVLIGRSPEATLSINDSQLSRLHARIYRDQDGSLYLSDLKSLNGTFCNEQVVERCPLRAGDRIRLGQTVIDVSFSAPQRGTSATE